MEYTEISLSIGNVDCKAFLSDTFFNNRAGSSPTHNHKYTEIHVVTSGGIKLEYDGGSFFAAAGEAFVIPEGVYHSTDLTEGTAERTFQITLPASKITKRVLPDGFSEALTSEIARGGSLCGFLIFITEALLPTSDGRCAIQNREFIIADFFENNYHKKVTLSDLAEALHLCKKQAERLVLKYTGRTFSAEIRHQRISAAKRMIKRGNASLSEIAQLVGYESYSGFWKAYKSDTFNEQKGDNSI